MIPDRDWKQCFSSQGLPHSSTHRERLNLNQELIWSYDVPYMFKACSQPPPLRDRGGAAGMELNHRGYGTPRYIASTFPSGAPPSISLEAPRAHSGLPEGPPTYYFFPSPHVNTQLIAALQAHYQAPRMGHHVSPGCGVEIVAPVPQIKLHPTMPFIMGYVSAIATVWPSNTTRLIRVNTKSLHKYIDAMPNTISSDQLIELYVCMECFDAPEIDLVKFRNGELVTVVTVQRNHSWFEHNLPVIRSFMEHRIRRSSQA